MRETLRLAAAIAACGALGAGCLSRPYEFSAERAERFIARNPDLPVERAQALRAGQVVPGMTREEVRLCLGDPQETRHAERDGQAVRVWEYRRPGRPRGAPDQSELWERPVPLARVYFGDDDRVQSCRVFVPTRQTQAPPPSPAPDAPDAPAHGRATPAAAPMPAATEAGFEGWPELVLNGVVVGAGEPLAIINRQEVSAGGSIEGVRVLQITARGVRLQRGETVRFLQTGGTTRP